MDNNEKDYETLSKKYVSLKKENHHNKIVKYLWALGCVAQVLTPITNIKENDTFIEFNKNNSINVISTTFCGHIPIGKDTTYFVNVGNGKYITKKIYDENQNKYAQGIKDSLENIYKQKTDSLNSVMANQKQHTIDSLLNYRK
jgi:hypothetical protein